MDADTSEGHRTDLASNSQTLGWSVCLTLRKDKGAAYGPVIDWTVETDCRPSRVDPAANTTANDEAQLTKRFLVM